MSKRILKGGDLFSRAVGVGNLIFLSGTNGRDSETGEFPEGGIFERTQVAFKKIEETLESTGHTLGDVVKVNVYLSDIEKDFAGMNDAFRETFAADPPARTTIGVASLPTPEAQIEVEVIVAS